MQDQRRERLLQQIDAWQPTDNDLAKFRKLMERHTGKTFLDEELAEMYKDGVGLAAVVITSRTLEKQTGGDSDRLDENSTQ